MYITKQLKKNIRNTGTTTSSISVKNIKDILNDGINANNFKEINDKLNDINNLIQSVGLNTSYENEDAKYKLEALKHIYKMVFNDKYGKIGVEELNNTELGIIKREMATEVNKLLKLFDNDTLSDEEKTIELGSLIGNIRSQTLIKTQTTLINKAKKSK